VSISNAKHLLFCYVDVLITTTDTAPSGGSWYTMPKFDLDKHLIGIVGNESDPRCGKYVNSNKRHPSRSND
jgi:hypothetical protein